VPAVSTRLGHLPAFHEEQCPDTVATSLQAVLVQAVEERAL
jgi:hypothetical protein